MGMTVEARVVAWTVAEVELYRLMNPDATADDIVRILIERRDELARASDASTLCKRCGRGIWLSEDDDQWRHDDQDNSRGCRAASFTSGEGWNETLDRTWKASPPKM